MCPNSTTKHSPKFKNRVGQRFDRLLVIEEAQCPPYLSRPAIYWRCQCDCGNIVEVSANALRAGDTQSCGCLQRELTVLRSTVHGMSHEPIYKTWQDMIARCTNPKDTGYPRYGKRGITVCDEWRHSFQAFYDHVSQLPNYGIEGYTLDRTDNSFGYFPGNVGWATIAEQNRNQRTNILITYNDKTQCLTDWAIELNMSVSTLYSRIHKGWNVERALTTPVGPNHNPHSRHAK